MTVAPDYIERNSAELNDRLVRLRQAEENAWQVLSATLDGDDVLAMKRAAWAYCCVADDRLAVEEALGKYTEETRRRERLRLSIGPAYGDMFDKGA